MYVHKVYDFIDVHQWSSFCYKFQKKYLQCICIENRNHSCVSSKHLLRPGTYISNRHNVLVLLKKANISNRHIILLVFLKRFHHKP